MTHELTIRIKHYVVDETKEVTTFIDNKKLSYEYTYEDTVSAATIESEVTADLLTKGIVWDTVEVIEE